MTSGCPSKLWSVRLTTTFLSAMRASSAKADVSMLIGNDAARNLRPYASSHPLAFARPSFGPGDAGAEVLSVDRRLEADQVVGRKAFQDAVIGRNGRRDVRGRERYVIEEADLVVEAEGRARRTQAG